VKTAANLNRITTARLKPGQPLKANSICTV